jgi:excisionase family DNA binding protein
MGKKRVSRKSRKNLLVLTVPEAGKALGLSAWSSYAAVSRGEIPVLRIGKRMVVPKVALQRLLEGAGPISKPT